jgi:membrane dipeptidase
MGDAAARDCLEATSGPVAITHTTARARVPLARLTDDTTARLLAERDGVIGIALYNRFLRRDHAKGMAKQLVTLADVVAHIDHFCQLLGSADHVALGSDFDGGFGANDIPAEFDSAADWPLLAQALREYGYNSADIAAIFHGNWQRLLRRVLA